MSNSVFVTGASGFVGGAITKALRGERIVKAMSRSEASDRLIESLGATPVRCELGAVRAEHLAGCSTVIHCAAFVKQWGTREQFWQANVTGTEQLLGTARDAGIARFIHIGTEAALFYGQHMRNIDETYPYPNHTPFLYSATKAAAEQRVLQANAPGFTTISIRPRFIWGPGDQTILPVLANMVAAGKFSWIDHGRAASSTTHIANLVHGIRLAIDHGRGGNTYFVVDDGQTTLRDFLTALLATRGVVPPDRSISGSAAGIVASVAETIWKLFALKGEPPLTRFAAAMMSHDCTIASDKAQRELNYVPVITRERGLSELTGAPTPVG